MIFNAMLEAMIFMKLLLGILIDIGKVIIAGLKVLIQGCTALVSKIQEGDKRYGRYISRDKSNNEQH